MKGLELYQNIVLTLRDTYLPRVGEWKEHDEEFLHGITLKYFDLEKDKYFIGVTVRLESDDSQPTVRVALFPLSHYLPDGLLKKIIGEHDVFAESCFVPGRASGETFNRICYIPKDAERPILAAKDYLQFVMLNEYEEIVDRYDKRIDELRLELENVEIEFAERLEELVKSE
ncbi:MAG: hypothetical protein KKA65_05620 [Nanoarchaeota archaeon]|nr:hypothetical protein [Nanoarchaeota archaeon]MBU4351949.1 hypothetical protein [Nanoarchaeota archaeon]MBU4456949.1 hypothetical protein [Nanoarchaeota archaeon]MCG2719162.1 hypothetical protein [Nanoarchaeota archaeon]